MKKIIPLFHLLIILASCGNKKENVEDSVNTPIGNIVQLTEEQFKLSRIESGKLEQKAISSQIRVNGKIDVPPQNMISISVPLGGYLKSTHLLEGMHITKGEVIAIMEDQQYIQLQQDYLTAKARFGFTENEFVRQKELNQSKASSDKVFQQAQAEYQSQKVMIKSLSEKLKLIGINPDNLDENTISRSINIYSPIDGFVSDVKMNIGKYVNPTDILFELVNPTDIHLALTIFEKDLDKLFVGQKIIAFNNADPTKKFICEIILIGQDISHDGTVTVHCHFEQYDKTLIPGMYMNAEIELKSSPLYIIPNEGIVNFEGKNYVFIQTQKREYQLLEINTLNSENGYSQLLFSDTTGVQDKRFVTKGAYALLMKMKNTEEE